MNIIGIKPKMNMNGTDIVHNADTIIFTIVFIFFYFSFNFSRIPFRHVLHSLIFISDHLSVALVVGLIRWHHQHFIDASVARKVNQRHGVCDGVDDKCHDDGLNLLLRIHSSLATVFHVSDDFVGACLTMLRYELAARTICCK